MIQVDRTQANVDEVAPGALNEAPFVLAYIAALILFGLAWSRIGPPPGFATQAPIAVQAAAVSSRP